MRLRPVGGVIAALLNNGPVPDANTGRGEVGELDVTQELDEASAFRRDAALGVVGALLPRADQQRATDCAVRHDLIALQRRRLDLPFLVGKPMVEGLGNSRGRPLVDVRSFGEFTQKFVAARLRVLFAIKRAANTLTGLGVAPVDIPLRIGGHGAVRQLTAALGGGNGDVDVSHVPARLRQKSQ